MIPAMTMAAESNGSCSTAVAPLEAEVDLVDAAAPEEDVALLDIVELVLEEDTGRCVSRAISDMNLRKSIQTIRAYLLFIRLGRSQVCG